VRWVSNLIYRQRSSNLARQWKDRKIGCRPARNSRPVRCVFQVALMRMLGEIFQ
jgi:hypothetical protein